MISKRQQLEQWTTVVADTGDLERIAELQPHDATTNPSLLLAAARDERYRHLLDQARELARELGLQDKLFTSVDQLSGGQAQRVALGRALYTQRPVLLADEPVSSLDEHQGLDLLQRALARHPTAAVALHDRELALQCCDRIIGLGEGKILLDAPASTLTLSDLDTLYQ